MQQLLPNSGFNYELIILVFQLIITIILVIITYQYRKDSYRSAMISFTQLLSELIKNNDEKLENVSKEILKKDFPKSPIGIQTLAIYLFKENYYQKNSLYELRNNIINKLDHMFTMKGNLLNIFKGDYKHDLIKIIKYLDDNKSDPKKIDKIINKISTHDF